MKRRGLTWRSAGFLALGLVLAGVLLQTSIRLSSAYALAAATYAREHGAMAPAQVQLCYLCASGISYGNGAWHFRFTLIDSTSGAKVRTRVRLVSGGSGTVTFP